MRVSRPPGDTPRRLADQVAIVTGGASGIGLAIARALAREGAAVVIADLDEEGARRAAGEITAGGGRADPTRADVSVEEDAVRVAAHAVETFGRLDILVNNAGHCLIKPFLETTGEELDRMYAVHVRGTFLCTQAAAREMIPRRYGRIVNIVSGGALGVGSAYATHYQAAKAAQGSLTKGAATALGPHGITVNAVCPGTVATPLWDKVDAGCRHTWGRSAADELERRATASPLGRVVEAEEVAHVVVFLALPGSAATSGQVIAVAES